MRYWTLTYGLNLAYAQDHGFEMDYVQPSLEHYVGRKIGWAKVKVLLDALRERGPERCAYGVSIDSDAFIRSSESLSAIVKDYGLEEEKRPVLGHVMRPSLPCRGTYMTLNTLTICIHCRLNVALLFKLCFFLFFTFNVREILFSQAGCFRSPLLAISWARSIIWSKAFASNGRPTSTAASS